MFGILKYVAITCLFFLWLQLIPAQVANPDMVFVRGGKFKMGSIYGGSDEKPVHGVVLDDFYIGRFEVSQREWRLIMEGDTSKCYFEGCDSCPVERVSWFNVQEYIGKLNEKTGMNYRLPTEAEWEYACSAGTTSEYYFGDDASQLGEYAWFEGNSGHTTHPVGQKKPNAWGLYDLDGNVWEWTEDWYDETSSFRVIRGGSWLNFAWSCGSAFREPNPPDSRRNCVGFRLVFVQ